MDPVPNKKKPEEGLTKNARFLYNLWWSTYQALVDAAGSDRALELIKPYMKFHFDAGAQILGNKYKIKTDDLYSIAAFTKFTNWLVGTIFGNYQFFEQGFTADVHYCPAANLSEALCYLNEYNSKSSLPAINSDYEFIYCKMLVRGDPFCQVMIKRKGHTIWGDIVKKPVEIPILKVSDEEREFWQRAIFSQQWIYATNALVDFVGKEKAVEILRPYMRALGMSLALDLSKEMEIKDHDAIFIAAIIERCNQAANQKGTLSFQTPERVEKEITECIFANASQDICADALEARANGICEAINPEYKFISLKRMCKGDKTCKWVIIKHQ
ncbi:MAG: L-2-amino-thiazoline-4-carboxylic acid hydrolase [Candidatus Methanoperedens sp.]|nr:L-2-amino-thiazoline-4-carboxylic acid hydrolase [Candidatus Methanoperedens sp.]